ncbi:MAG: signal peptidase I [Anaerolineae bacterium]|nr:signal peptidase I [Anaerolineae bacterium]MDW8100282.1 signal peptidase I [Anaerolineae bacterium]
MENARSLDASQAVQPQPVKERASSPLRELIETLALALLIFLLIRSVVQNFRIEGISMEPNFHHGQFLIINKLAYKLGRPARGDVVIFHYPRDPSRDFIKRVIGLPGDTVEVRQGQVLINGVPIHEPYPLLLGTYSAPPVTVGPNEVYVLGDNRNNSSDSHTWGNLPMDLIVGKAWISYWPPRYWSVIPRYTLEIRP